MIPTSRLNFVPYQTNKNNAHVQISLNHWVINDGNADAGPHLGIDFCTIEVIVEP